MEEEYREQLLSGQQLEEENESLREQLTEAQETTSHLSSHVNELHDKYEECSVLLKETQVCRPVSVVCRAGFITHFTGRSSVSERSLNSEVKFSSLCH